VKVKKSWKEIQDLVGISRATYHRWQKALKEKGLAGLKPRSRRPKHLRTKVHWTPGLLIRIETLRKENPTWGRWSIWLTLRKEGFQMSERTVGRILAYLEKHRRIESVAGYLARTQRGKLKAKGKPALRQKKGSPEDTRPGLPGDLVQVDTSP
jgi:putative transposase